MYERFVEALVERTKRVEVGHPMADDTDIGPLALASQLDKRSGGGGFGRWWVT
ncbi:MAG: unnamed protein product [uncultured Caballeronia sp.]|nr:MAG: unnamed protein product [uncultured Caballeronia sp.]